MEWDIIAKLIKPELLGVVALCWVFGFMLKKTPRVPDWTIIYLVTLVSVGMVSFTLGLSPESVLQGVLCGAVAVYGNQLVKQARKGAGE
jgi:hypothetical protein